MPPRAASLALALLAACGGRATPAATPAIGNTPPARTAPVATAGILASATTIELKDVWVGLGCPHDFHGTLTAAADGFHGTVELAAGWSQSAHGDSATVTVPRDLVVALDRAVAEARTALAAHPPAKPEGLSWTDDYPSGSMTFRGPAGTWTLGFTDQHRMLELEHDGAREAVSSPHGFSEDEGPATVWDAYQAVLAAAQLGRLVDEQCGRH